jgi:VanZ family protein
MAPQLSDRKPPARFSWFVVPVVLYVVMIFSISAQPHLKLPVDFNNADKLYHFSEYGGLGLLIARALNAFMPGRAAGARAAIAIGLGLLVATCDEIFQSTVPGRTSSVFDAMADTLGVALAQWVYALMIRRRAVAR